MPGVRHAALALYAPHTLQCPMHAERVVLYPLQRVEAELAARDVQSGWSASYALANLYKDGSEAVGAHSGTHHERAPA